MPDPTSPAHSLLERERRDVILLAPRSFTLSSAPAAARQAGRASVELLDSVRGDRS